MEVKFMYLVLNVVMLLCLVGLGLIHLLGPIYIVNASLEIKLLMFVLAASCVFTGMMCSIPLITREMGLLKSRKDHE